MDYIVDTVELKDSRIYYTKFGYGQKTLIVLPGLSFRPLHLFPESLVDAFNNLTEDFCIYVLDVKDEITKTYTINELSNDTLFVIKELGLKDIYLFGASLGGMMALNIALKEPKLIKKMIVASSSPYVNSYFNDFLTRINELIDERNVRSLTKYFIKMVYSREYVDKYGNGIIEFYKDLNEEELMKIKHLTSDTRFNVLNDLPNLKVKTLFIASKLDKVFTFYPTIQAACLSNSECVLYDEFSHAVYDEAEDFKERVKEYFSRWLYVRKICIKRKWL